MTTYLQRQPQRPFRVVLSRAVPQPVFLQHRLVEMLSDAERRPHLLKRPVRTVEHVRRGKLLSELPFVRLPFHPIRARRVDLDVKRVVLCVDRSVYCCGVRIMIYSYSYKNKTVHSTV